jgi:2-keto-4-pentenoate hydratase/2-oxohepta-3-ene-1,7-dioic acid hydratase in catechol pathway
MSNCHLTLHPGDVVTTGSPPGIGLGVKPPQYLEIGDVMRLEIDGLGRQRAGYLAINQRGGIRWNARKAFSIR